jgi:hypothetical protein
MVHRSFPGVRNLPGFPGDGRTTRLSGSTARTGITGQARMTPNEPYPMGYHRRLAPLP